jgi:hypothetical protein
MTRTRWTGLAGLLFAILFASMGFFAGSTPDAGADDAPARYLKYWSDSDHQDKARIGALVMTYVFVLLLLFSAGLRDRLRAVDAGPLPSYVLASGVAAAALILTGAEASLVAGIAGADSASFKLDGNVALMLDDLAYALMAPGLMAAATMAVMTGIVTRRTGVLPAWTAWLGFLLGLSALGSFFSAWVGFFGFPLWAAVVSIVLLVSSPGRAAARH